MFAERICVDMHRFIPEAPPVTLSVNGSTVAIHEGWTPTGRYGKLLFERTLNNSEGAATWYDDKHKAIVDALYALEEALANAAR